MQTKPIEPQVHDEAAHLIAWHDGDAKAAIRALLKDRRHLHEQMWLNKCSINETSIWLQREHERAKRQR